MKRADVISTIQRSSEDETKFLEMMDKHVSAFGEYACTCGHCLSLWYYVAPSELAKSTR